MLSDGGSKRRGGRGKKANKIPLSKMQKQNMLVLNVDKVPDKVWDRYENKIALRAEYDKDLM